MNLKEQLDSYVQEGLLDAIPNGPLTIYNYRMECQFSKSWNPQTLAARGLVLDQDGKIIALPMKKFFNLGEMEHTKLENLPKETPELSEKYDGSMIIIFFDPYSNKWRAITRGCWDNVQTQFAYKWLESNTDKLFTDNTYIFELVAPWNRIVCHYSEEKMILIGIIHTESGEDFSYQRVRSYAKSVGLEAVSVKVKPIDSIDQANPNITNEEGFVARFSNGLRVKIKYEAYKQLHKVMTGLSTIGIWEGLSSGSKMDMENVPDEFMAWFNEEKLKMQSAFKNIDLACKGIFMARRENWSRKEAAQFFMRWPENAGILFRMLDGKPYEDLIWKQIRPEGKKVFKKDQA